MKVILLEDVKSVGKKGDVVEANDAFARNVLLRKKQAVEATGANLNSLKLKKANDDKIAAENLAAAQEVGKKLEASEITLQVKVGEGGKLFGSISTKDVAEAVKSQLGIEVDKKKVVIDTNLKSTGVTQATIKLHTKVSAQLKVNVVEL